MFRRFGVKVFRRFGVNGETPMGVFGSDIALRVCLTGILRLGSYVRQHLDSKLSFKQLGSQTSNSIPSSDVPGPTRCGNESLIDPFLPAFLSLIQTKKQVKDSGALAWRCVLCCAVQL